MAPRLLLTTTALTAMTATMAWAVDDAIKALPAPEFGAETCVEGDSDPDGGPPCWIPIAPTGDVAVWGEYEFEFDRTTATGGQGEWIYNSGGSRLEFTLDSEKLYVDSTSLFLQSGGAQSLLTVGTDGGSGAALIGPNSLLEISSGDDEAVLQVGNGGQGLVTTYESGLSLLGTTGAKLELGAGDGTGVLRNGVADLGYASTVSVFTEFGTAAAVVGADGTGQYDAQQGQLLIEAPSGDAILALGSDGGTGNINLTAPNALISLTAPTQDARVVIGASQGGYGQVDIVSGGLSAFDAGNTSEIFIGAPGIDPLGAPNAGPGGTGVLNVSGLFAMVPSENDPNVLVEQVQSGSVFANTVYVGVSAADAGLDMGGFGTLNIGQYGIVEADELYAGEIGVAGGGSSSATITVTNGGLLKLFDGGEMILGGNSNMQISGETTRVQADNVLLEGFNGHEAVLRVDDEGVLDLGGDGTITVGEGGVLMGRGGVVNGDVILDGGRLAPGASPGTLDIAGDLFLESGILELEFAGTAEGEFDVLNIGGSLSFGSGAPSILVKFLDDFLPQTGDVFNFLNIGGETPPELQAVDVIFDGLFGDAPSLFGDGDGSFAFAYADPFANGDDDPAPVPLPAGLPMLFAGLAVFGGIAWRGRRAA